MKLRHFLTSVSLALIVVFCFNVMFRTVRVSGTSMTPTLKDGQIWLSVIPKVKEVNRDDIITFNHNDKVYVKRVMATAGDKITVKDGDIYVNNVQVDVTDLTKREISDGYSFIGSDSDFTVPRDCYFVLGDNRNNSEDSRSFGWVSKGAIEGILVYKVKG